MGSLCAGVDARRWAGIGYCCSGYCVYQVFYLSARICFLFFPAYYLFNFSSKMRRALRNNDQLVLTDSLKNLKSYFKFYGILGYSFTFFIILAIIAAVIGAMVGHRQLISGLNNNYNLSAGFPGNPAHPDRPAYSVSILFFLQYGKPVHGCYFFNCFNNHFKRI